MKLERLTYYIKRLGSFLLSVIVLSLAVFFLSRLAPTEPLQAYYGERVEKKRSSPGPGWAWTSPSPSNTCTGQGTPCREISASLTSISRTCWRSSHSGLETPWPWVDWDFC